MVSSPTAVVMTMEKWLYIGYCRSVNCGYEPEVKQAQLHPDDEVRTDLGEFDEDDYCDFSCEVN